MLAAALVSIALGLPQNGLVVPGQSLGGLRLGATKAQVLAAWGPRYGRCRDCSALTWYFTYKRFEPQGAGVTFAAGRAAQLFTVWGPPGWHTNRGLTVGDPAARATQVYGVMPRIECGTYEALLLRRGNAVTEIYVYQDEVWGFGLSPVGAPPCH